MNLETGKALVQDALYQVLDNKIFRLMVLIVIVFVVPTWLIAFREDSVSVLFGWSVFEYDDFPRILTAIFLGEEGLRGAGDDADVRQMWIQGIQRFFVDGLAGTIGVTLAVAATAFFLPRMLEKGAADTLFSKPVHRLVLLLARYFSGVLFVAILAALLVGGMHLGFLVVSGYSDPGFLWGGVIMVYLFGIVHAISILIGTLTRSSVAAMIATVFIFMFSGCIHQSWIGIEFVQSQEDTERLLESARQMNRELEARDGADVTDPGDGDGRSFEETFWWIIDPLNWLHFALPKTTEAGFIAKILRRKLESGPVYELKDEEGKLIVDDPLEDFVRLGERDVDLDSEPVAWIRRDDEGAEEVRLELSRFNRKPDEEEQEEKRRPRLLSATGMANRLLDELDRRSGIVEQPEKERGNVNGMFAMSVEWREKTPSGEDTRRTTFFGFGDWMFRLDSTFKGTIAKQDREEVLRDHLRDYEFAREDSFRTPDRWFEEQFSFAAPWRYNAWFSIGSTLAFVLACIGLAWFRLGRIDF